MITAYNIKRKKTYSWSIIIPHWLLDYLKKSDNWIIIKF